MADLTQQIKDLDRDLKNHQNEANEKLERQGTVKDEIRKLEAELVEKKKEDQKLGEELKKIVQEEDKIKAELRTLEKTLQSMDKKKAA